MVSPCLVKFHQQADCRRRLSAARNTHGEIVLFFLIFLIFVFLARPALKAIGLQRANTQTVLFLKSRKKGDLLPSVSIVESFGKQNKSTSNVYVNQRSIYLYLSKVC